MWFLTLAAWQRCVFPPAPLFLARLDIKFTHFQSLNSYADLSVHPKLHVTECTANTGDFRVSYDIDRNFEDFLKVAVDVETLAR